MTQREEINSDSSYADIAAAFEAELQGWNKHRATLLMLAVIYAPRVHTTFARAAIRDAGAAAIVDDSNTAMNHLLVALGELTQ